MYKFENEKLYIPNISGDKYSELKIGLEVIDIEDYGTGTIENCNDLHNVIVKYPEGGKNLYCLVENCDEGFYDDTLRSK